MRLDKGLTTQVIYVTFHFQRCYISFLLHYVIYNSQFYAVTENLLLFLCYKGIWVTEFPAFLLTLHGAYGSIILIKINRWKFYP